MKLKLRKQLSIYIYIHIRIHIPRDMSLLETAEASNSALSFHLLEMYASVTNVRFIGMRFELMVDDTQPGVNTGHSVVEEAAISKMNRDNE